MSPHTKFSFDTVFAETAGQTTHVDVFSGDEVDTMRDEAWNAGFAEGTAREQASTERTTATALETIGARLASIASTQTETLDRTIRDATGLAMAIARKVATESLRRHPLIEIEGMIGASLARLIDEPRVAISVPDALLDELKERIGEVAARSGFDGKVVLLANPSLDGDDCRMEWADGGAERDTCAAWTDLEATIERLLEAPAGQPGGDAAEPNPDSDAANPTPGDADGEPSSSAAAQSPTTDSVADETRQSSE